MNWRDHIYSNPEIGSGKPIFRDSRFKVEFVLKLMAAGWTFEQMVEEYPGLSDLVYRGRVEALRAILYLRCDPVLQPGMADRVLLVLANATVDGHMVVIQPSNVRYRPLPEKSSHG